MHLDGRTVRRPHCQLAYWGVVADESDSSDGDRCPMSAGQESIDEVKTMRIDVASNRRQLRLLTPFMSAMGSMEGRWWAMTLLQLPSTTTDATGLVDGVLQAADGVLLAGVGG